MFFLIWVQHVQINLKTKAEDFVKIAAEAGKKV